MAEAVDGTALLETRVARAVRREGQPRLHEYDPVEVANLSTLSALGIVLRNLRKKRDCGTNTRCTGGRDGGGPRSTLTSRLVKR